MKILNSSNNNLYTLNDSKITIYNCGPTVYNDVHVGNIRPIITMDVLYRYLCFQNIDVTYVHNITDIDDKIINRSLELHKDELELSNHYYEEYLKVLDQLNIKRMSILPKVSDNIEGIIDFVNQLINKKHAYVVEGDVYFDIKSIKGYGSISHQNINNLLKGVRKEVNDKKHFALDFALWKKTNVGINWKTKWNDHGRPGWHTECVYLINHFIGKQVDIHAGGVDLKFPHHENENAQNIAINNIPLAKCWMHIGHINVNGEKMSKSLNNFILAKDILKQFDFNVIRWFFYQTRYQSPLNFSIENLNTCKKEFLKFIKNYNFALINYFWLTSNTEIKQNNELPQDFINTIEDDLNFPNMIKEIWAINKKLSLSIRQKKLDEIETSISYLNNIGMILGLDFKNILCNNKILNIVKNWAQMINEKKYHKADELRGELQKMDII